MIPRALSNKLTELASWFPIVSLTGPRQSGKSTLVREAFSDYEYINLEEPAVLERATTDPSGFVASLSKRTIIDEAQRVPELFSSLQVAADESSDKGQYILTGSQNYLLLDSIRQSLAGRVGLATLMPLSYKEIVSTDASAEPLQCMLRGAYPVLHATTMPTRVFYDNYIETYVTRDALDYLGVRNELAFKKFIHACAVRSSNLVNYADLARDVEVNVATVRSWLSILAASHIVNLLPSYSASLSKRLTKAPKLYFTDTGLLCHLLGVQSLKEFQQSEYLGQVFETFVLSERLKYWHNAAMRPDMYFYRDDSKIEVDLVDVTNAPVPLLCEIKSGQTYRKAFARNVRTVANALGNELVQKQVVYGGGGTFHDGEVRVDGIREWLSTQS